MPGKHHLREFKIAKRIGIIFSCCDTMLKLCVLCLFQILHQIFFRTGSSDKYIAFEVNLIISKSNYLVRILPCSQSGVKFLVEMTIDSKDGSGRPSTFSRKDNIQ